MTADERTIYKSIKKLEYDKQSILDLRPSNNRIAYFHSFFFYFFVFVFNFIVYSNVDYTFP